MLNRHSLKDLVGHPSISVAHFILADTEARGYSATPMKLLKMAFLAHGWTLGIYGVPLISEQAEAWEHGPVFPTLYHAIKHRRLEAVQLADLRAGANEVFEPEEAKVMNHTVTRYGSSSATYLSTLTHARSSPWEITYRKGVRNRRIPNELIEFYYEQLNDLLRQGLAVSEG